MEPSQPTAEAVVVVDGMIADVGTESEVAHWLEGRSHEVVDLAEHTVFPGFIDNHLHPSLAGLLLQMPLCTPDEWHLPTGAVPAVRDRASLLTRLADIVAAHTGDGPIICWGWHGPIHGPLTRQDLDALCPDRPMFAWGRSFHDMVVNTEGLRFAGIDPEATAFPGSGDVAAGYFAETAMMVVGEKLIPFAWNPEKAMSGLGLVFAMMHRGGITTIADQMFFGFAGDADWDLLQAAVAANEPPLRMLLVPAPIRLVHWGAEAFDRIEALPERNTERIRFAKHVKMFADGAFISQAMQLRPPGYVDGHHGEWMTAPEQFFDQQMPYWTAGYTIHIHVNGDLGIDAVLDTVEQMQTAHPRVDHRYTLHHFGISAPDQVCRMKELGVGASVNGYYLNLWGNSFVPGLGHARASEMIRCGSLAREGVRFSLHSDVPMGPCEPLVGAWAIATRRTIEGGVLGEGERVDVDTAMRAITIDAAYAIKMDHEIGSIAVGKRADFTVLDDDPYDVDLDHIADISIWGTVLGGVPYPIDRT